MVENPVENPDAIATHPELLQLTRLNQTQQLLPFTQGQLQMLKQIDVKCATQLASHMTASAIESLREAHRPGSPSLFRSSPPAAANTGMDDNRNERWFGMG